MQKTYRQWKAAGAMALAAVFIFLISACGGASKPTAELTRQIFEDIHKDVKIISFKLTRESDIKEVEVDGKNRKVAFVEYEAEVECLQDIFVKFKPCKQGEKRTMKGMINFKNDGEGWKEAGT